MIQEIHPVIKKLFQKKNFNHSDIKEFFSWNLKELPSFNNLIDITTCANIIIQNIQNNKKIAIYGDYDVDGTTSCALFYLFFKKLNIEVELIQPSRFIEGYGLHNTSIDQALQDNIDLLVTVDCGITNVETASYAKEKGLQLIITDHHKDIREEMPDCLAVVNPNRRDQTDDNLRNLAGVGVAFAICVEIKKNLQEKGQNIPSIYDLLQLVAIGTICDLAELCPMNLKLVRHGMKLIKTSQYPGIRAFFTQEDRKKDVIPSEKLSFNVGPLINSKGRLEHPKMALKLLLEDNEETVREYLSQLEICNNERKLIQKKIYEEAKEQVLNQIKKQDLLISIVYSPNWHEGVIGIVASKLVETFKVPAIVFCDNKNKTEVKASARSVKHLNIFELLQENSHLFTKFGGHKAAAGLSMPKENIESLKNNMEQSLLNIPLILRTEEKSYDLEISSQEITPRLLKSLEMLEPYGMGNEKPIFKIRTLSLKHHDILKDLHIKWHFSAPQGSIANLNGISFNYVGKWGHLTPKEIYQRQQAGEKIIVFGTLAFNYFNRNKYIQIMVNRIELE